MINFQEVFEQNSDKTVFFVPSPISINFLTAGKYHWIENDAKNAARLDILQCEKIILI